MHELAAKQGGVATSLVVLRPPFSITGICGNNSLRIISVECAVSFTVSVVNCGNDVLGSLMSDFQYYVCAIAKLRMLNTALDWRQEEIVQCLPHVEVVVNVLMHTVISTSI